MQEHQLIKQILAGDAEQFGRLLERYQPGLVRHCFALVHDYDTANDMAQEAGIKAYLQLGRYRPEYRFSTWLYKIATNCCLDYLRRRHHLSLDDIPELASPAPLPAQVAEQTDAARRLHAVVAELPLNYQAVISLYYWHDQSYEEIAEIMNAPLNTVRTWLRRAKDQLKENLHE
jgi:RNA polymerase sigma-70 factor (ECF subfamily)